MLRLSSSVFCSTPRRTFCVCSPRRIRITPSTASLLFFDFVLEAENSQAQARGRSTTWPTSLTRIGTPLLLPTTTSPMSSVDFRRPRPRT